MDKHQRSVDCFIFYKITQYNIQHINNYNFCFINIFGNINHPVLVVLKAQENQIQSGKRE